MLRKKFIAAPLFRDFAMSGARIRLVQLEKERMAIHNEFPELLGDSGPTSVPKMPSTKSLARTANGKRTRKKGSVVFLKASASVLEYFSKHPGLAAKPKEVADKLGMTQKQANNAMLLLKKKKLLKLGAKRLYVAATPKETKE